MASMAELIRRAQGQTELTRFGKQSVANLPASTKEALMLRHAAPPAPAQRAAAPQQQGMGWTDALQQGGFGEPKESGLPSLSELLGSIPGSGGGGGYNAAYEGAMEQSRSHISSMLQNALNEINTREGLSFQALDTMPGTLNEIYGNATNQINTNAQVAADAQVASGLKPLIPAGAEMQPILAANNASLASRLAEVPLLRTGLQSAFSKERQTVQMAHDSAMADLAASMASASGSGGGGNDNEEWLWKALVGAAIDREGGGEAPKPGVNTFSQWGVNEMAYNRGAEIQHFTPTMADAIRSGQANRPSKVYAEVRNAIRKAGSGKNAQKQIAKIIAAMKKKYTKQGPAVSLALFDEGVQ